MIHEQFFNGERESDQLACISMHKGWVFREFALAIFVQAVHLITNVFVVVQSMRADDPAFACMHNSVCRRGWHFVFRSVQWITKQRDCRLPQNRLLVQAPTWKLARSDSGPPRFFFSERVAVGG